MTPRMLERLREPRFQEFAELGERGRNRTYNLLIKSQLLCQLSYAPGRLSRLPRNGDSTLRRKPLFPTRLSPDPM